jgi:protein SCO1
MTAAACSACAGVAIWMCAAAPLAHADGKPIAARVGIDERIGVQVPLELEITDHAGRVRSLRELLAPDRPLVLSLAYYHCPGLCDVSLRELATRLRDLGWKLGTDYRALTVSIDPHDTPLTASAKRINVLKLMRAADDAAWDFATASQAGIEQLTAALGYRYDYDAATRQYAHPAVSVVLTPSGSVARYLYGPTIEQRTLSLALREARAGRGSPTAWVDRTLLACFRYDAATHRYEWLISSVMRGGATLSALLLGAAIAFFVRRGRACRAEA